MATTTTANTGIFGALTHFIQTFVKHNPKLIKQLTVTVTDEVSTLESNVRQMVEGYLTANGLSGTVVDSTVQSALDTLIKTAEAKANEAVTLVTTTTAKV